MSLARAPRLQFACAECGALAAKWQGRCDACGAWNAMTEERQARSPAAGALPLALPQRLDRVGGGTARRTASGIGELDRVLGGGVVAGSLVLLGGDPGIGKSTLALQLAARVGSQEAPVLYCAGEESAEQLAMRAERLDCAGANVAVLAETDLDAVIAAIERERPPLAVVDSVQTLDASQVGGSPGSPAQVRAAVSRLLAVAKQTSVPIVLVGHVTKDGAIAGPRTLEHMVDVVLYLEGERHGDHRLLRGVKNRFGGTGEIGLFAMEGTGLRPLDAPSRAFLDESGLGVPGNVLTVTCEGTRPIAVELQALVVATQTSLPRRTVSGFDLGRLHLLLAVLERRAGLSLSGSDVYLNVVGGLRVSDPAVDLAVVLAVATARTNVPLPPRTVVIGEVGLGGEVRRVPRLDRRLAEAATLGQVAGIVPAAGLAAVPPLQAHPVTSVADALARAAG
ncbi:MAG: DNA repair protein RadA [Candidatus Dormibacteria bacterium]